MRIDRRSTSQRVTDEMNEMKAELSNCRAAYLNLVKDWSALRKAVTEYFLTYDNTRYEYYKGNVHTHRVALKKHADSEQRLREWTRVLANKIDNGSLATKQTKSRAESERDVYTVARHQLHHEIKNKIRDYEAGHLSWDDLDKKVLELIFKYAERV
jgi:hypothetical protein